MPDARSQAEGAYELRFFSIFLGGHTFSFPCDAEGHVDLGDASEPLKSSFSGRVAAIGLDFMFPVVCRRVTDGAPHANQSRIA